MAPARATRSESSATAWTIGLGIALIGSVILTALDVPVWVRAIAQIVSAISGIFLGVNLQKKEQQVALVNMAKGGVQDLIAIAESIRILMVGLAEFRGKAAEWPEPTAETLTTATDAYLTGADSHVKGILQQALVAAEGWRSVIPPDDPFRIWIDQPGTETSKNPAGSD